MSVADELLTRNTQYVGAGFEPALRMMPALRTIVIACVDPRVDPERLLGVSTGEVAVIRNVGGRVTPDVLDQLALLRSVTRAAGADLGEGWELIVLQHTDCGITRLVDEPLLATFLGVEKDLSERRSITDPWSAVADDLQRLGNETRLGAGITLSGLVYDVTTGRADRVGPAGQQA